MRKTDEVTAGKIRGLKLKGIYEINEKKRLYPNKSLLARVLGFCNIDDKGLSGIELVWDKILFSPPGYKVLAKESSGRTIDISRYSHEERTAGPGSVTLTVDSRIQFIIEKRLEEGIREHKAKWGSIICLDPNSGAIVGMASWPSFDPNVRESLKNLKLIMNNSIGRTYEPGSTFKPVIMGIALERGAVRLNESFKCPYRIKVADGHISEASNRSYGRLSVSEILVKSSNTGMAQVGMRVKPFDMYYSVREWGFGKNPGVELNGVEDGLLSTPEQWRGVVPSNIAIGQGLAITPFISRQPLQQLRITVIFSGRLSFHRLPIRQARSYTGVKDRSSGKYCHPGRHHGCGKLWWMLSKRERETGGPSICFHSGKDRNRAGSGKRRISEG